MARANVIDLTKRGPGTGEGIELDLSDSHLKHPRTGLQVAQISSVSGVFLEKRIATDPETWVDVTSQVTFGTPVATAGKFPNGAVRFLLQLDKDNTPPAGKNYQVVVEVVLDNGQGEAAFAPVRIWESAAVPSV